LLAPVYSGNPLDFPLVRFLFTKLVAEPRNVIIAQTLANIRMNEKIYLKFEFKFDVPKERNNLKNAIGETLIRCLTAIVPKANPDFEHLLEMVDFWKIEYNLDKNATWREIGFDKNGKSIVAMPLGKNYGFWTDNTLNLKDYESFEPKEINAVEFEKDWAEFENKMIK